ncbi:MAG: protein-L-isoaspartate(D-aspartate) O-methyltransferase [Bacteroidales bacterium]|nr:protein-L-isoaspartate(D-aspartate) O-methyltransferase [Candidatus Latescibacterota bacterium]
MGSGFEPEVDYSIARKRMVRDQLSARGIENDRLLQAFMEVPRHLFLDPATGARAYDDCSFPIGYSQTISQPYTQAMMMQYLQISSSDRILEVGTGSGYQTAILSLLGREVFSVERIAPLSRNAGEVLSRIRTGRIRLKITDGSDGWEFYAPYDKIIVSAAMREKPVSLIDQLGVEGMLIAPVAKEHEHLVLYSWVEGKIKEQVLSRCAFVPLLKGTE